MIEVVMLVVAGYFAAAYMPSFLSHIATTDLTDVSPAVTSIFQTFLPLTFVGIIIILFLSVLIQTFRGMEPGYKPPPMAMPTPQPSANTKITCKFCGTLVETNYKGTCPYCGGPLGA